MLNKMFRLFVGSSLLLSLPGCVLVGYLCYGLGAILPGVIIGLMVTIVILWILVPLAGGYPNRS